MKQPLHIIHVEDSEPDGELVKQLLRRDGLNCEIKRVETRPQLVDALTRSDCDLILSDYTLPGFNGMQALEVALALRPQLPFIFVSGTMGEETAVESLRRGATDYVLKDRVYRLGPAVRRALKEAEERVRRRAVEKRVHQARRLQAIGTLASGVARDMNKLLATIKEQAALLTAEYGHDGPAAGIVQTLDETVDEGCELMERLLACVRKKKAHFVRVELLPCVKEIVNRLHPLLRGGWQVDMEIGDKLPSIFADPAHVERILADLIVNARDAMPDGGRIGLSAQVVEFDSSSPYLLDPERTVYVCLKVKDSGMGMDEATRLRVFEPFFSTKPSGGGDGLGLPEALGLMRIHNGLIDIQSEPGRGTTVSLYFPLPRNAKVAPAQIMKIPPVQLPEVAAAL